MIKKKQIGKEEKGQTQICILTGVESWSLQIYTHRDCIKYAVYKAQTGFFSLKRRRQW